MLIVSNWKAYVETPVKAKALAAMAKRLATTSKHTFILAPSAPHAGLLATAGAKNKNFRYAAQDVSLSKGGAATGETTARQFANLGITHTIIGHSERRAMGETDAIVLAKVQEALSAKLTPILCIGERSRDADANYLKELRSQLDAVMSALSSKEREQLVIAYEPVWAIGKSAREAITPNDLHEMVLYIRKLLGERMTRNAAAKTPIIYGGSAEPGNIADLAGSGVNGFLIGHASADTTMYASLVKALPKA